MEGGCKIYIKVKLEAVKTLTIDFDTEEDLNETDVLQLKYMIYHKEGIPAKQQTLTFNGKTMENRCTLSFYGVKKDDAIYNDLIPSGGDPTHINPSKVKLKYRSQSNPICSTSGSGATRKPLLTGHSLGYTAKEQERTNSSDLNFLRYGRYQTATIVIPETSIELTEISYRLHCPHAGLFQCSLTGLMFLMDGQGEVLYKTVQWDEGLLASTGRSPAGPLFNINCPQGSVCQLHLPHCEIVSGGECESLSVAHVTGGSVEILPPLKVTDSHVVVDVTDLSLWGLISWLLSSHTIKGQVLLFLQLQRPMYTILNVIILPGNVPLSEVREKQDGTTYLRVNSDCRLTRENSYSLSCRLEERPRIHPKHVVMDWNYGPNYHPTFQVFLRPVTQEAELSLLEGGLEGKEVWSGLVPLTGASVAAETTSEEQTGHAQSEHAKQQLKAVRLQFVQGISAPMLNSLLDELRQRSVITQEEEESVKAVPERMERARRVIDTVMNKGAEACSIMKNFLLVKDLFLSKDVGL